MSTTVKKAHQHRVSLPKNMSRGDMVAKVTLQPEVQAGFTIQVFENSNVELTATISELRCQIKEVQGGNMKRPEAMLVAQMHTLDQIFKTLAVRAHGNMEAGYGEAAERYMKLALRAQNQCRTTIETLSAIKNPPVVFAKQMNVSNGHQQINNGTQATASDEMRTHQNEPEQNKLLEADNGKRLDIGTTSATIGNDCDMATVVKINRA